MLRPSKVEIERVADLLEQGADSPEALAESVIKLVEQLRQERQQWAVVFELTPGVYQGYGFWATKLMASKQMPKLPMAQVARRGGPVPILGQAAADAGLAKADEPPAERSDFKLAREDQQAFRRPADAQRRGVAQPGAGELLNSERQVRVRQDVDIDSRNAAADNTDAAVRPARPCRNLDLSGRPLCMTVPFGVIDPCAALVPARLLTAGRDGQDRIAVG